MSSFYFHRLRRLLPPFLLFLGIWNASCGFKNAVLIPPPPQPAAKINDVYVILLLIDGARPQELDRLVAAGRLPKFQELFYQQGARFQDAISVLPTVSTPAHQAFISGLFPGHHGIPNLDWFSRSLEKYIDYLKPKDILLTNTYMFNFKQVEADAVQTDQPQLIYHFLQGHPTMTVFETATSGVTNLQPAHPPFLTAFHGKIEKFYERFDLEAMRLTLEQFRELPPEELPRFSYVSCYGMDLLGHFAGPGSARVEDLYLQYDRFFGELEEVLRERGIWEKSVLVVVSDHGQHALERVTDLPALLFQVGLDFNSVRPTAGQVLWGDHGTGFSNLYFKMGVDWSTPPNYQDLQNYPLGPERRINLIEAFLASPDIQFVVAPEGPWRVHLHAKGQHARFERRLENGRSLYAYQPDPGTDPLQYLSDPILAAWGQRGEFHDAEEWLQRTHDKTYPDAVVLLSQSFADHRIGDLLLFTMKETQFKEKRLSGHGSMDAEDLRILMLLHGPDIKAGVYPYARSVDLLPTLLALYGLPPPRLADGIARPEILSHPPHWEDLATNRAPPLSADEFGRQIQKKLSQKDLKGVEREKAVEILYGLQQYQRGQDRYLATTPTSPDQKQVGGVKFRGSAPQKP